MGQRFAQVFGQDGAGAGVDQQRLGGDAFGIDNLVAVKQQLEIIDKAAVLAVTVSPFTRWRALTSSSGRPAPNSSERW